jgi:Fur family ferric uptake transcriptional regulator
MRASSVESVILDVLNQENTHLTSLQVYEKIRPQLPAVNPSTVYRALERLAKNDKISVSDIGTGAVVYETRKTEMHHHLVCQNCGQISTIGNEDVSVLFSALYQKNHFVTTTNHLILFGLCENCSKSLDDLHK